MDTYLPKPRFACFDKMVIHNVHAMATCSSICWKLDWLAGWMPEPIDSEVRAVILEGEVIEDYPEDARGHSCLMIGQGSSKE